MTINTKATMDGVASDGAYTNAQLIRDYTIYDITITEQFSQAMQAAGISYSGEIIPDGSLHRFHIDGHKSGTRNGAYTLHIDNCPAGWFMDYMTGLSQTWRMNNAKDMRMSFKMKAEIDQARRERIEEIRKKHAAAANKSVLSMEWIKACYRA